MHDEHRKFDGEDKLLLENLGDFADNRPEGCRTATAPIFRFISIEILLSDNTWLQLAAFQRIGGEVPNSRSDSWAAST